MTDFTGTDEELTGLLNSLHICSRVWEAWSYGTMTEDDFSLAGDDADVVADFTAWRDAAVKTLSHDQRWQVGKARDLLARWDRERFSEDGYGAERMLADQVRALLAIIDHLTPEDQP